MEWLDLMIVALATWRLSVMLVREAGPWWVFHNLRERLGISHDDEGAVSAWPDGPAGALACVWCCAVWVAAPMMALYLYLPMVATLLAVAAVAAIIDSSVPGGGHG